MMPKAAGTYFKQKGKVKTSFIHEFPSFDYMMEPSFITSSVSPTNHIVHGRWDLYDMSHIELSCNELFAFVILIAIGICFIVAF